jgi:hypothetical protein
MTCLYETHSPREIVDLITWLPDESPLAASLKGGREYLGWTWDRIVLTLLFEQTRMNGVNFIRANSEKNAKVTAPTPIKWPGRVLPKTSKKGSFLPIVRTIAATGRAPDIKID